MTELMMHFRGRDVSIHCSPEGLDRVARLLVELSQRAEAASYEPDASATLGSPSPRTA